MNQLDAVFAKNSEPKLAIYTVIDFPDRKQSYEVFDALIESTIDIIELGIPFSDPVADGPVIQRAHEQALRSHGGLQEVLKVASYIRSKSSVGIVAMGYVNPILAFGIDAFLTQAIQAGINALIIPDVSPEEFVLNYKESFEQVGMYPIFLVSPNTPDERVHYIDTLSKGFLYAVSGLSITGTLGRNEPQTKQRVAYLTRLQALKTKNPLMVGFGISSKADRDELAPYCAGTIVGSAFIQSLNESTSIKNSVKKFLEQL